jgi:CO/xanthine dehydrogenase FAD-binding subunit
MLSDRGGQSLVAMMNLRLATPGLLIDAARLPELAVVAGPAR